MTKPSIQLSGPYRRPRGFLSLALRLMAASLVVGWVLGIGWGIYAICRY